MKTYVVFGDYHGKVLATVRAESLLDALRKFRNAEEDTLEVYEPSQFEYKESDVREDK